MFKVNNKDTRTTPGVASLERGNPINYKKKVKVWYRSRSFLKGGQRGGERVDIFPNFFKVIIIIYFTVKIGSYV